MKADLYLDSMDLLQYVTPSDCRSCGCASCGEWLSSVKRGIVNPDDCPSLGTTGAYALELALSMERILPEVAITQHPVQGLIGHQEINNPGPDALVLVTGNGLATQEVLMAVLSTTTAPFHLLFVDCLGHTVDMAMIFGTFSPRRLRTALETTRLAYQVSHREMILPGITSPLKDAFQDQTGWTIRIGPRCAGELPLYLGDRWTRPGGPDG
jgi:CO dehydrogenase/acetyl-CoA synthase gamma subunit (corrinoid Fe-S protein)